MPCKLSYTNSMKLILLIAFIEQLIFVLVDDGFIIVCLNNFPTYPDIFTLKQKNIISSLHYIIRCS